MAQREGRLAFDLVNTNPTNYMVVLPLGCAGLRR